MKGWGQKVRYVPRSPGSPRLFGRDFQDRNLLKLRSLDSSCPFFLSDRKPHSGGIKTSRRNVPFYVQTLRKSLLIFVVPKCRKCARFPCENANLPHCTYFTHIPPPPPVALPRSIQLRGWYLQGLCGNFWLLEKSQKNVRNGVHRYEMLYFLELCRSRL